VTLPSTIREIGNGVFQGCTSLASITLPPFVTILGDSVFLGCSSLSSITLPPTIITIGNGVFQNCLSLTSITLPSATTTVGNSVFQGCSSLNSIVLPSTITTLGDSFFRDCSSLTSVRLPENLIAISRTTFDRCTTLTTIKGPSFSTTTFNNIKELCIEAGFSCTNLANILSGLPSYSSKNMYFDMKKWATTRSVDCRLPLCIAAARSIRWTEMRHIFAVNMPAIYEVDVLTGLPLFMLAAVGSTSDLESIYTLLKVHPAAIYL